MTRTARLTILVASVLVLLALPASAADEIGLSRDGVHWSASLTAPLFDPAIRWVPSDSRQTSVYVRNQAREGAEMEVDVLGADVDSLLETGDLDVWGRVDGGAWQELSGTGARQLLAAVPAQPGDVLKVDVRVDLDATSVNTSQALMLNLNLRVRLTQAGTGSNDPGSGAGNEDTDGGEGHDDSGAGSFGLLPDTGGPASWVLVTGVALLASGTIVASRRREGDELDV